MPLSTGHLLCAGGGAGSRGVRAVGRRRCHGHGTVRKMSSRFLSLAGRAGMGFGARVCAVPLLLPLVAGGPLRSPLCRWQTLGEGIGQAAPGGSAFVHRVG